jgi:hypothetical protein
MDRDQLTDEYAAHITRGLSLAGEAAKSGDVRRIAEKLARSETTPTAGSTAGFLGITRSRETFSPKEQRLLAASEDGHALAAQQEQAQQRAREQQARRRERERKDRRKSALIAGLKAMPDDWSDRRGAVPDPHIGSGRSS